MSASTRSSIRVPLRAIATALMLNMTAVSGGAAQTAPSVPQATAQNPERLLEPAFEFSLGLKHPNVVLLRERLAHKGFPTTPTHAPDTYDLALLNLVRTFQVAHGLTSTGIPRSLTIAALNATQPRTHSPSADPTPADPPKSNIVKRNDQAAGSDLPTLDAGSLTRMREELSRYIALESNPDLSIIPPLAGRGLGSREAREKLAQAVAQRLRAEGLLEKGYAATGEFDEVLRKALGRWQQRYGLNPTGRMNAKTRARMNLPISLWIRQLEASIKRVEQIQKAAKGMFVLVNVADARVQVLEGDSVRASLPAIAGRGGRRSPEFLSAITHIHPFPTWTVPASIVRKDIAPKVRKDPSYLERHHMRAMIGGKIVDPRQINWRRGPFPTIVQKPGPHNALGLMRFGMKSHGAYYLHGTSQPKLLMRPLNRRFVSSGCVRLADPFPLALLLLTHSDPGWTEEKLRAHVMNHDGGWEPGTPIKLKQPVAVVWTYLTAWTTADGSTHFRDDVYGRNRWVKVATRSDATR